MRKQKVQTKDPSRILLGSFLTNKKEKVFVLDVHSHKSLSSCRLSVCQAQAPIPSRSLHLCWTSSLRQIWWCHIVGCSCRRSQTRHLASRQELDGAQKRRNTNSPAAPRQAVINLHAQAKALVLNIYAICIQIRIRNKSTVGAKARAKKLFSFFSFLNILHRAEMWLITQGWEWGHCLVLLCATQRIPFSSESTDNRRAAA